VDDLTLVALLHENSFKGWDAYRTVSRDGGLTWGPPIALPIPACQLPVVGWWTQNTLAVLTDRESLLAPSWNLTGGQPEPQPLMDQNV
jgi:hypothetical protein